MVPHVIFFFSTPVKTLKFYPSCTSYLVDSKPFVKIKIDNDKLNTTLRYPTKTLFIFFRRSPLNRKTRSLQLFLDFTTCRLTS